MLLAGLVGCGSKAGQQVPTGVEDGILTIAMECAYALQLDPNDGANGAVPSRMYRVPLPTATMS